MNFARRSSCNRCGESKPFEAASNNRGIEIGKSAADKSKGLFSAEDWQCGKCSNVNWARRSTCNVCNAPRVSDVEERTGLGGGFNERAGVEYIARQDSDDEFDDFGRRKKKFRSGDAAPFKPVPEKRKEVALAETGGQNGRDVEEDDDEEEDEDPDDLSKYDLSGWGDEEETAAVPDSQSTATLGSNDKQTGRRRARSSSGSSSSSSGSASSSSSGSSRQRSRNGRSGRGLDGGRGRRSSSGDSSPESRRRGAGTAASRSRSPSQERKRRRRHRRSSSSSSR